MEHDGFQNRREFLVRALALASLATGDSLWRAAAAAARTPPKLPPWSGQRNLTGPFGNPLFAVAADAGTTYLAKCDGSSLQFARSLDQGQTFSGFTTIPGISGASDVPLDRPLVVDPVTKRIHLLYSAGADDSSRPASLLAIHSDDHGASWSRPLMLDDGAGSAGLNHGTNRFIRVAMSARGGVLHVAWSSISNSTFLTDGMFYARSTNGGGTFSAPVRPFAGAVSPSRPDIAVIGRTVLLTWTDARYRSAYNGNPGEVFVGRSVDGGATWTQRRLTFTANAWGAGMTLRPVICAGAHGTATIVWQQPSSAPVAGAGGVTNHNSPGTEDLFWAHSKDAGRTWSRPRTLVHAASSQEHADLVQVGNVVACTWSDWRTSPHQIRVGISTDGGATFGPSSQPGTAAADVAAPRIVVSKDFLQIYASEGGNGVFQTRLPYRRIRAGAR